MQRESLLRLVALWAGGRAYAAYDGAHGKSTSQSGFGLPSFLSISLTGAAAAAVALLGSARSALRSSSSSRLSSRSSLVSVPLKVGSSRCSAQLLAWRRGSG